MNYLESPLQSDICNQTAAETSWLRFETLLQPHATALSWIIVPHGFKVPRIACRVALGAANRGRFNIRSRASSQVFLSGCV